MRQYATAQEEAIIGHLGVTFRATVDVEVRRPRWMPGRMYRALMRTIVVKTTAPRVDIK
jgi:hypothetical protein